jgi:hypothetical protein
MKKNLIMMLAAILLCGIIALTSCSDSKDNPATDPTPTEELADYTLFIYGHAGGHMDQIIDGVYEKVKPLLANQKKVRVLVFYKYGHHTKDDPFTGKYADEDELLRFELTAKTDLSKLRAEACFEENSQFQLYSQENLTAQLNWAAKTAPAKNYIVMLYGHGAGFNAKDDFYKEPVPTTRAVLYDEGFKGKGMNMYEFKSAIEASDIKHPKMIFFHNCLMGNLESLTTLRNLTDYYVGSQHVLASLGYIIVEFVKGLLQTTDIEAATKQMFANLDDWRPYYSMGGTENLSNGDLFFMKSLAIEEINEQMDRLCSRIRELYPTQQEAIDNATCKVYQPYQGATLFDAADYADCLARETSDAQLQTISKSLRASFDKAFLARDHVNNRPDFLDAYTLSVTLVDKTTFTQELKDDTGYKFSFSDSYFATGFHTNTGWGHWLAENNQKPTDNPFGMKEEKKEDEEDEIPGLENLEQWRAGTTVSQKAVEAFGLSQCFNSDYISDEVWARMQGKTYKENPYIGRNDLRHVKVLHWDYDEQIHIGEMICNERIAFEVCNIMQLLYEAKYPIQRMVLPDVYNADDEAQMRDNNSSCFCYCSISGSTTLSKHARGLAVDINTLYNPYYKDREDGTRYVQPSTAEEYCDRTKTFPYKIDHNDLCFKLFTEAGFEWGGDWTSCKDFQHFELIEK